MERDENRGFITPILKLYIETKLENDLLDTGIELVEADDWLKKNPSDYKSSNYKKMTIKKDRLLGKIETLSGIRRDFNNLK